MNENLVITTATRRQILRPKCTKFDFRCGSAPDPWESSQCFPDLSCI